MKSIQLENEHHKRLKILSANVEKPVKDLLVDALNLLFKEYKEKEIKNGNNSK